VSSVPASAFLGAGGPRVFAHRGFALAAPENSLLAFLSALSAGATHIETDVQVSVDGAAIISHDPDLAHLGRQVRIDHLTRAELGRIDLGHGQSIPSLVEALDAFPDARFNIDIKADAAVAPTIAAVLRTRATSRVLITSFSEQRRRRALIGLPGVATSGSSSIVTRAVAAVALGPSSALRRALRGIDAVQVPERTGILQIVTPRFIRHVHGAGVEVHVWTVNDTDTMQRLLDMGVDGLITDRTDLAIDVISRRN